MDDIQAVHEVKALIPESVNVWKNYKKRMPSRSSAGVTRPSRSAQGTSIVYSQLSGLENVGFNDFIKDDFTEGTIYCPQILYWVGGGCGEECGKEGEGCWPVCSQV